MRPHISEPIDYESFVSKYREILQNDPQRELVLFPMDDFTIQTIQKPQRTTKLCRDIPDCQNAQSIIGVPLYVRDSIDYFSRDYSVLSFKYGPYSGSWLEFPKNGRVAEHLQLEPQLYEMDDAQVEEQPVQDGRPVGIVKEGFILKGSEAGTDSFISVATKSFKRRWMSLRQEADGTCMLEFHKDAKKIESKGAICLDFCSQLVKVK